ncbi:MAG: hypothetical protein ACI88A_000253 [Paraglaciecola sp.]|jgi:hypothetical protein
MIDDNSRKHLKNAGQTAQSSLSSGPIVSFWSELKRRNVVRVAWVYIVVAWLVIQVASTIFSSFGIPLWAFRFVVIMLVMGLPISLILAWTLELTPDGVRWTAVAQKKLASRPSPTFHQKRGWFSILFAIAVPTLIFGSLSLYFFLRLPPQTDANQANTEIIEQSIAVLPLVNMSAHPDNVFFAGGVHEDILTNLSQINGLKVISKTSAMHYFNSQLSLREIGVALGARYIVEGSVRRINNHVRAACSSLMRMMIITCGPITTIAN